MKTLADYNIDLMGASGEEVRTLCPECTPQRRKQNIKDLCVNTNTNTWFCHHCGWKGGLAGNTKTYVKPVYKESDLPAKVVKWFSDRGISEATLKSSKVGYGPIWMPAEDGKVNAIQFPFYKNGVVVNVKYRDGKKNFRQAKDAEKCFYGFDRMKNETDTLIITEGEIDALTLVECGFYETVSMPDGAPPDNAKNYSTKFDFLKSAEEKINRYKKIILCVDGDGPGQLAEKELARRIGIEKCLRVKYPKKCKDINEVLQKHGREAVKKVIKKSRPLPIEGLLKANDLVSEITTLYDYGIKGGEKTGWKSLDEIFSVKLGETTIVTGIPGSGKSNFIDAMFVNLMDSKQWKFAIYSPENWPVQRHIQTLSEKITGRPFFESFGEKWPRIERDEIPEIADYISDHITFIQPSEDTDTTVDKILELARKEIYRNGIQCLVIDPWNEIHHEYKNMTEVQYISKELGKIRRFGRLNQIHIFIIAHPKNLTKNSEGFFDPPTMYDIAGGAMWRNKADNGICVHRCHTDEQKDHVQIIVQKIRFREVGKIGMRKLRFEYATAKYIDDIKDQ